jgi:hypothetical protein
MRYHEIFERLEGQDVNPRVAKQKRARDKIAKADQQRSAAAQRYQNQLRACSDAVSRARAALREGSIRSYPLRDSRGVLFGWIEPVGRLIQAKDRTGSIVGWYDPHQNDTRDRTGKLVGSGDLLSAILVCPRFKSN